MGACLSCLGLGRDESESTDRARLLYDDHHNIYGTWGGNAVPPPDQGISAEEERRLQHAWDGITQWAGNQIVEIFPSQQGAQNLVQAATYDGDQEQTPLNDGDGTSHAQVAEHQHQDILLAMIPGDKSKRSIRIYPASRPNSRQTDDVNGVEDKKLKEKASGVFVKMDLTLP